MSSPIALSQNNINFLANPVITKTVSSKIASEKSKLLRLFKEILSTDIPEKTEEDILLTMLTRAHNIKEKQLKKQFELTQEMEMVAFSKTMNPQLKYDTAKKLLNELNRISKINPYEYPKTIAKPSNDNYDYVLINKFKNAIQNDNFDLKQVFIEHYSELASIQTVEELNEKYPSIKTPKNPKNVISKKIIEIIPRSFYERLDETFQLGDRNTVTQLLLQFFKNFFDYLTPFLNVKNTEELHKLIGKKVIDDCVNTYYYLVDKGTMSSIPEIKKSYIPAITEADKQLLHVDFDKFVLSVIRQQYLEGKKLNDIIYQEDDKTIKISDLKNSEYKFEKFSEKIKKFISDSEKIQTAQRDYQKFTPNELKSRLNHYLNTELGNNEKLLEIFIDFDSCKFTQEDKQYFINFLQKLDEINDGKISTDEAVEYIEKNNIKPLGTAKLNEAERKIIEEKIKNEQQKTIQLNNLKKEFNETINKLYQLNMNSVAEEFIEYSPEDFEEKTITNARQIIKFIEKSMKLGDSHKIKTAILRLKIYHEYSQKTDEDGLLAQALEYGNTFGENEKNQRCGQYLLNRELLNNYPDSKDFFPDSEMAERIIKKFGSDTHLTTLYLCKYENYKTLCLKERQLISNISAIFDYKNTDDKVILKNIIEKEFINTETRVQNEYFNKEIVIKPSAKQEILNKYRFPNCMEFFIAFEEAMSLLASKQGSSGVKRIETGGKAGLHQIELKIMGFPDRLFSSNNDFVFDIYSEKGLH